MLWYEVEGGAGGGGGGGDGGEEENTEDRGDPKVRLPNFVPMSTLGDFFSLSIFPKLGHWTGYHS